TAANASPRDARKSLSIAAQRGCGFRILFGFQATKSPYYKFLRGKMRNNFRETVQIGRNVL
ncbi:MAG: hypothetical protein IKX19_11610, partial [Clostridia bacterium]|nr:hypothetical protein [Clostridia bacterium]